HQIGDDLRVLGACGAGRNAIARIKRDVRAAYPVRVPPQVYTWIPTDDLTEISLQHVGEQPVPDHHGRATVLVSRWRRLLQLAVQQLVPPAIIRQLLEVFSGEQDLGRHAQRLHRGSAAILEGVE